MLPFIDEDFIFMDLVFQKNTQDCRVFEGRFNYNWKFSRFVYVPVIKLGTSSSSDEAVDSAHSSNVPARNKRAVLFPVPY